LFSYIRYDADISEESQIELGATQPCFPLRMDDVGMINHFDLLGKTAARLQVNVREQFGSFATV
jgi:hypothetical protein